MPSIRSESPMTLVLLLTLTLLGRAEAKSDPRPSLPPLAVLLSAEVEDLDRDLDRQREAVVAGRQRLAAAQRLAMRGLSSRDEIEQEAADARFQEARAAEMASVRDLKAHQRDVLSGNARRDDRREFDLVMAVLKSQETTARIEADFRAYRLRQAQALYKRNVIAKLDIRQAELEANSALMSIALLRARQARLVLEFARRPGAKAADPAELTRLKVEYLRALVRHERMAAILARTRLDLARDRALSIPPNHDEIEGLQKASEQASATLAADRKRLAELDPTPLPEEGDAPKP